MDVDTQIRNVWIALGTLSGVGIIVAVARTWAWYSKSGKEIIDLPTIGKLILHICGVLGTVLFLVMALSSVWWLLYYKNVPSKNFGELSDTQWGIFRALFIIAFVLKTLDIFHLIIRQTGMDLFLMDWERSKTGNMNDVSVWRTYFVANEFNEIQTFRRINVVFQLILVLFFLKVINFEYIARAQSDINLFPTDTCITNYSSIFRVGIGFLVLLGTALIQYITYIVFYQRFVADKILNFIDLCSVSNVSVFILNDILHGYYIHGRSPHGITDVNMKEMLKNLERESNQMSATRGLEANSTEQIFIMKIDKSFRIQYDVLLRNYRTHIPSQKSQRDVERQSDIRLQSYQKLNAFLCAFIDHSLPEYNYTVRKRYLLEKILNHEFQIGFAPGLMGRMESLLFADVEKSFAAVLFFGHESSLLIWNMATFLFVESIAKNYILAAFITYLLNSIAVGLRNALGRKNLSKKTLIPRQFLI